jgi:hypothetical protein
VWAKRDSAAIALEPLPAGTDAFARMGRLRLEQVPPETLAGPLRPLSGQSKVDWPDHGPNHSLTQCGSRSNNVRGES